MSRPSTCTSGSRRTARSTTVWSPPTSCWRPRATSTPCSRAWRRPSPGWWRGPSRAWRRATRATRRTRRAFYAELFDDDWCEIDWSRPARAVHNQVRSWIGGRGTARGAFGALDGERVLITKTRLVDREAPTLAPGATLRREDGTLLVGCGDRPLAILAWEPADAADRAGATEAPPRPRGEPTSVLRRSGVV